MSTEPPAIIDSLDALLTVTQPGVTLAPVWAYVRVSGAQQARDGLGLEGQIDAVLAYCEQHGLHKPVIVKEVGSAGKPLLDVRIPGFEDASLSGEGGAEDRPLLVNLLATLSDADRARNRTLVVWKLDRLSRVGHEQETLLRLVWRAGVKVASTYRSEEGVLSGDNLDPGRQLMRQIYGAFAQYERALIQARMQMGLRAKAHTGRYVTGPPPYGYESADRDIRIHPDEAKVVVAVFLLRKRGLSLQAIVDELARRGVQGMYRTKVHRILESQSLYEGVYRDPWDAAHSRPDLRILPPNWKATLEEEDAKLLHEVTHEQPSPE